jgi:hypothetical protein
MKQKKFMQAAFFLACFISNLKAQKPNQLNPLEIKLPAENESYYFDGNNRILNRTHHPVALYQVYQKQLTATPELMARNFLKTNQSLLGLTDTDIQNNLKLHQIRQDDAGTIVRLRQTCNGLTVNKNAEITISFDKNHTVDFVMNGFRYGISSVNTQPGISSSAATQTVYNYLHLSGTPGYSSTELMVLQNNNQQYLVYKVMLEPVSEPVGEWEAFVDAHSGVILQLEDISCYHHRKAAVKPLKTHPYQPFRVQVNGTGNVFDPDPLTTAISLYGGSYVDGSDANAAVLTAQLKSVSLLDITLATGTYSLVGPYAEIRDFEAPSKGLFTQASSIFAFNRVDDAFEAVNTYYHIDAMMRYLNTTLGLSIQPYQYAGGVRFDPSGLSGADNSHYLSGSGSLAFGEGGVDDAEDADVIIHELGHGLHDWFTAGGLSQVNGLSEGTGDYIAGSYSRFKGYWPTGNAAYNWTFNWDGHNPFWAGRVLNYAAVYPGGLVNQIHTDGQIWATANMKIWDDIGRQKADKVFWSGLATTNSASSQNDAAVAVFNRATALGYTNTERLAIHTRYTAAGYTMPLFVLPVNFLQFTAIKKTAAVQLNWSVENETAGTRYEIEKSGDGINFTVIGSIPASALSPNGHYIYTDAQPFAGKNYYRIKDISANRQETFSPVKMVLFELKNLVQLFPNPATERVQVNCTGLFGEIVIRLFGPKGEKLIEKKVSGNSNLPVYLSVGNYPSGTYPVTITNNDFIINKQLTIVK